MEKRLSDSEKSWKTQGSNFRATDKQQIYSTPACPPNIAPSDVVQAWVEANQCYTGQAVEVAEMF